MPLASRRISENLKYSSRDEYKKKTTPQVSISYINFFFFSFTAVKVGCLRGGGEAACFGKASGWFRQAGGSSQPDGMQIFDRL